MRFLFIPLQNDSFRSNIIGYFFIFVFTSLSACFIILHLSSLSWTDLAE